MSFGAWTRLASPMWSIKWIDRGHWARSSGFTRASPTTRQQSPRLQNAITSSKIIFVCSPFIDICIMFISKHCKIVRWNGVIPILWERYALLPRYGRTILYLRVRTQILRLVLLLYLGKCVPDFWKKCLHYRPCIGILTVSLFILDFFISLELPIVYIMIGLKSRWKTYSQKKYPVQVWLPWTDGGPQIKCGYSY